MIVCPVHKIKCILKIYVHFIHYLSVWLLHGVSCCFLLSFIRGLCMLYLALFMVTGTSRNLPFISKPNTAWSFYLAFFIVTATSRNLLFISKSNTALSYLVELWSIICQLLRIQVALIKNFWRNDFIPDIATASYHETTYTWDKMYIEHDMCIFYHILVSLTIPV